MTIHRFFACLPILIVLSAPASAQISTPHTTSETSASLATASASLARQQTVFIENKGQWDSRARFLLRTAGIDTWITDRGVTYDLYRTDVGTTEKSRSALMAATTYDDGPPDIGRRTGHVVHMSFAGAAGRARGSNPLAGHLNYIRGNDPARWVTHVARYADARISNLYDGVDAFFYVDRGHPRYDLIVAPGADPSRIRMSIEGASRVDVTRDGALRIETSMGPIEQRELQAYQEHGGQTVPVTCAFRRANDGSVAFAVGSYDRTRELVIDPLVYSTLIGGSDYDDLTRVSLDADRNIYLVGSTNSFDFPATSGAYQSSLGGTYDATLTKLNAGGGSLAYATYLGGDDSDGGVYITLDGSGNPVITGGTNSYNFPITLDAIDQTPGIDKDIFVTAFDSDGIATYSTRLGGSGSDSPEDIAIDTAGNIYIAGYTWSSDYPTSSNAYDATLNGTVDAILTVFDPDAGTVLFSTYMGGDVQEGFRGMELDAEVNVILTGGTSSTNFPTLNAYQGTYGGVNDAFIAAFESGTWSLLYSTYFGGSAGDVAWDVTVGSDGDVYVTGETRSTNLPTTAGALDPTKSSPIDLDAFVARLEADGSALVYSTYLGGSGHDYGQAIRVDAAGNAYVSGYTTSSNFPTTTGAASGTNSGQLDVVVARVVPDGSSLGYSTYIGGAGADQSLGLTLDGCGDVYVAGYTTSTNFPVTSDALQSSAGGGNGFLARVTAGTDAVPPVITVSLSPALLWPPNHSMSGVQADVDVADNCGDVTYTLTSITSDEADLGLGDGDRPDDVQGELTGTPDVAYSLRAERSGEGDGRVYTITYIATDAAGNSTDGVAEVLVPHSQNRSKQVSFTLPHLGFASRIVPNPVRFDARLEFHLAAPALVVVRFHDARGETVGVPVRADLSAGPQSVTFTPRDANGSPLPVGTYYYTITADGTSESGSILLVR